jgi:signal transduction histidine kinase
VVSGRPLPYRFGVPDPVVADRRRLRALRALVAPRTWLATVHTVLDLVVGSVIFLAVATAMILALSLACTVVFLPPALWLTFIGVRGIGRFERLRFAALLDVRIPDPYLPVDLTENWLRRQWRWMWSAALWKEVLYTLILLPMSIIGVTLVVTVWGVALAMVSLPATIHLMPGDVARFGLFDVSTGWQAWAAGAVGLVLLLAAPWVSRGWATVDTVLGSGLLGRNVTEELEELEERVDTLVLSRAQVIEIAEAERRRIERDLHDGAQQRLVALAMDLGMAREKMDSDPEGAKALVTEAHQEAKRAIAELRDLARGIHPVALGDRGLEGAVPALAGRCPLPVETTVALRDRPTPSIEGITYFIVSESLANAVKHGRAGRASVRVEQAGDRLQIEVSDDGIGGADPALGSGLRGLAERAASVDGTFEVWSPLGGPTVIRAELPCAS